MWPVRVYYEDTDGMGVVYHANHLRFLERARTEWLRARGIDQHRLAAESRLAFTVSRMLIDYFKPARLDDLLEASVRVAEPRKASMVLEQAIRHRDGDDIVRATVRVACIDVRTLKPRRIPYSIYAELIDAV